MQQPHGASRRARGVLALELQSLPPALRPLLRAYVLGYASAVAPRIVSLVVQRLSRPTTTSTSPLDKRPRRSFVDSALLILRTGCEPRRFPTFCALLVGASTLLQGPLGIVAARVAGTKLDDAARQRVIRSLACLIASWFSLRLLQSKPPRAPSRGSHASQSAETQELAAGRTLDLTLFAAAQAIDVVVGELWSRHRARRTAAQRWTKLEQLTSQMIDPVWFAASCGLIMWAWFYAPDSLPRAYNKWIASAAQVDMRLIEALRRCRSGELQYAKETGQAPLLGSMCKDYGIPYDCGDPVKTIPFPCDIVHMGQGPSCEYHAWSRFWQSWKWAMCTNLPLALALQLRKPTSRSLSVALKSASRSSAFLATFITLFYYGVCLGRTRIGPHLIGTDVQCRSRIDGGVCVGTGCFLCGWSVLVESAGRRKDMALFVAPRAMATLLPRRYSADKQWRETLAFAASTAIVFTCVLENPKRVRGMMGGILSFITRE